MLVEDDLVHCFGKFKVDLTEQDGRIRRTLSSKLFGVLSHTEDSVDLLVVNFWDLMSWHVLNVKVVLKEGVCHFSGVVSMLKSFGELSWIFFIKENKNSVKSDLLFGVLPVAFVSF